MQQREAVSRLETYLRTADPKSVWWAVAYERYQTLCRDVGIPAAAKAELIRQAQKRWPPFQQMTSLALPSGQTIARGRGLCQGAAEIGRHALEQTVTANVKRDSYPGMGIDLLVDSTGQVKVIYLVAPEAPVLLLVGQAAEPSKLHVGMTREDFDAELGNQGLTVEADSGVYKPGESPSYRYYPRIGLGVRFSKGSDPRVVELVIGQLSAKLVDTK